ncbi:glycosyltransferase family 2 protein [Candidatus Electronema sp. PJ]|uniref:glycosyltransferase family 2 protein n=1 Tax=Candidatus Electronema sp. PJ TaxID=3401572 RepID=UPI003AA88B43
MSASLKITAIICTHNRERFIEKCINSLYQQTLDQSLYAVLVVDNGSTDRTAAICQQFTHLPNFKYVYEAEIGLSCARNTGWKVSRTPYIGYLDDDAVADRLWLEKALWSFEQVQPQPEWVGGPVQLEWEVPAPVWLSEAYYGALGWVNWGDLPRFLEAEGEWLVGCNSFYRLDVLQQLHGFDTRLGRKKNLLLSGEEVQFQHRLRALGGRLYYHPDVCMYHFVPKERTEPSFFYKRYYWGGITDYIISRTLKNTAFVPVNQQRDSQSLLKRLLSNSFRAIGCCTPTEQTIQSRIYLAYVVGWLVAAVKYSRQKMDLAAA